MFQMSHTVEQMHGEQCIVKRVNLKITDVFACGDLTATKARKMAREMQAEEMKVYEASEY